MAFFVAFFFVAFFFVAFFFVAFFFAAFFVAFFFVAFFATFFFAAFFFADFLAAFSRARCLFSVLFRVVAFGTREYAYSTLRAKNFASSAVFFSSASGTSTYSLMTAPNCTLGLARYFLMNAARAASGNRMAALPRLGKKLNMFPFADV